MIKDTEALKFHHDAMSTMDAFDVQRKKTSIVEARPLALRALDLERNALLLLGDGPLKVLVLRSASEIALEIGLFDEAFAFLGEAWTCLPRSDFERVLQDLGDRIILGRSRTAEYHQARQRARGDQ